MPLQGPSLPAQNATMPAPEYPLLCLRRCLGLLVVAFLAACAAAPTTPVPTASPTAAPVAPRPVPPPTVGAPASAPASAPATSGGEPAQPAGFVDWVSRFRETAQAAGIDEATLHAAFDGVAYLPRVVDLDRAQPEFTRPVWAYLDGVVTARRVEAGRAKLLQLHDEASAASARYGVPSEVLIAIWGIESDFGNNYGDIPTIDALATLAFEGRREAWARGQLLDALKILQSGDIDRARMIGSWAGAMGQTQFLPSAFLAYAVDADGDGRRDIWGSMADVLASTANFLARSGWQADQPWGIEVRLPPGFDLAHADDALHPPSAQWTTEGVQTADGSPLPELAEATMLLPAGARGPAFLVGPNFRAIRRYNNSVSYALAVGLLAQRLAGGLDVQAPWPRDLVALTRTQLLDLQTTLNERGFDSGKPDGLMGPATRDGVRRFQRSVGLPADGYPTLELLQRLKDAF
jgi:lytic murein transglycosylase